MTISNGLMIVALILGPILAVQAQKIIESWKESKGRKISIFKTLMATRGTPLSPRHVEALNMIDLEFSGKDPKDKAVLDSWKEYHDHLFDAPRDYQDPTYHNKLDTWTAKSNEYLVNLLYAMAQAVGYTFDKVQLKKGAYTPQGYADLEFEFSLIRRGILDLLYEKKTLPIRVLP
jgi:hypothetical protein